MASEISIVFSASSAVGSSSTLPCSAAIQWCWELE